MFKILFRIAGFLVLIFSSSPLIGQTDYNLPVRYTINNMYAVPTDKDSAILKEFVYEQHSFKAVLIKDGKKFILPVSSLEELEFNPPEDLHQFWTIQRLKENRYKELTSPKGIDWELGLELDELSQDALTYYERNDALYQDLYLEAYLHALVHRIYPTGIITGLSGLLNVRILKDTSPNAVIFPNGTLLINSGLLSVVKSESELIAVLAHQIAHYVLEHTVKNIKAEEKRRKRAEFLSYLATAATAAVEVGIAANNENYVPGYLTLSIAVIASSISTSINRQLGLDYNREQELEVDLITKELLDFIVIDTNSLSNALLSIYMHSKSRGDIVSPEAPNSITMLAERLKLLGGWDRNEISKNHTIRFSGINSINAQIEYQRLHLPHCLSLVKQNINAGIASGADYLLAAKTMLYLSNDSISNKIALGYLKKSKAFSFANSIELDKVRGIFLDRLGDRGAAKLAFDSYMQNLEKAKIDKEFTWEDYRVIEYLNEEIIWAKQMQRKLIELNPR
jgi:Zn-dependent protease with chaperone function